MKDITFKITLPSFAAVKRKREEITIAVSLFWAVAAYWIGGHLFVFNGIEILILLFFGLAIIWKTPGRYWAIPALIILAAEPFLLSFGQNEFAETLAVYAYYFLVITVVLEIIELRR